ncbi:MAG: hypothetical protein WD055_01050 [Candidatus Dependentiae bacterium]
MKYRYLFLLFVLPIHAQTLKQRYDQLMKNPGYQGMSYIEIAADIEDFEGIRHFAYKATQEQLTKARELLVNKADILAINIKELHKKLLKAVSKGLASSKLYKARNLEKRLKNEIRDLNRRIKKEAL